MILAPLLCTLMLFAPDGMKIYKSKDFTIRSNASTRESKALGKRITFYLSIFEDFYKDLGLKKKSDNRLKLRLFATHEEFEAFYKRGGGSLGSTPLAYWSPSLNSIVMYSDERDVALKAVVFHETSHQFLSHYTSDAPKWLNEGLSEYFEGWKIEDAKSARESLHLYDLAMVQGALKAGHFLTPQKLISMSRSDFNNFAKQNPKLPGYLHYATSWSLVYYGIKTRDERDHERLLQYFHDLRDLGPNAKFDVPDWPAFTERWKAFILDLDPSPSDALDHFLIGSGHRRNGKYSKAVKSFESALALDPKMPGARYWVGYCQKRLGRYDLAYKALEQVLVDDPEDARAPYYLARMHLGIDRRGAKSEAEKALTYAELASDLLDGKSPYYLELIAQCQIELGEFKQAKRTLRKVRKAIAEDDLPNWKKRLEKLEQSTR